MSPSTLGPDLPSNYNPQEPRSSNKNVTRSPFLNHVSLRLSARRYKSDAFAQSLLVIIKALNIPSWSPVFSRAHSTNALKIHKVSGSLTNAVFFVTYPPVPSAKTLLLRIYGPSSSELISRTRELHVLHTLSSTYRIGPRLYGTFENGRVEEYFDSVTLTARDVRDPMISQWIGARMAELHLVDIDTVEAGTPRPEHMSSRNVAVWDNVKAWVPRARLVLELPGVSDQVRKTLQIEEFVAQWERYVQWVIDWERMNGMSKRVFAHNDAQYGNLLKLSRKKENLPEHRQIIVVDFEYASPNPAAFDIANHFHEWTADYHGANPHILCPIRYPNEHERKNFYKSYLTHLQAPLSTHAAHEVYTPEVSPSSASADLQSQMKILEEQVRVWSPASHAMWAIWGIVQAREDVQQDLVEGGPSADQAEFDYLGYAMCRLEGFRRELDLLGV